MTNYTKVRKRPTTVSVAAWFILTAVFFLLPAGAFASGNAEGKEMSQQGSPGAVDGIEAPALAQMVKNGTLPELEERIGTEPMVLKPVNSSGVYGGTLYSAIRGAAEDSYLQTSFMYEPLVRWNRDVNDVIPGVAKSWEVNDEATEFTFHLRKGMKWSDGTPLTSDHFVFYVNDIAKDERLPNAPEFLTESGEWGIEKIDDFTFTLKFEKVNAFLLIQAATTEGGALLQYPSHYMKKFHIKYNPNVEQEAKAQGYADWIAYFSSKTDPIGDNPDLPVVTAWKPMSPLGSATSQFVMERNPYYFKVDEQGRQLPYIDKVIFFIYDEIEPMVLKALNGEIDYMDRRINTIQNKALFYDNQQQGGYRFIEVLESGSTTSAIFLNQTVKDPVLRQVFSNKKFRQALSHAIDRQAIIDVVFVGQGEPWQTSPLRGSGFYNEKLAKQYTNYDPALANRLLDEAGFNKTDKYGWRLGPDGKPITFVVTTRADKVWHNDIMEMIVPMWHAVGINVINKPVEKSFQRQIRNTNQHDVLIDDGDNGWVDVQWDPILHVPLDDDSAWAIAWYNWYYNLEGDSEEPPAAVKKQFELFEQLNRTADTERQKKLTKQILEISADNFYVMGITPWAPSYGIVNTRLQNVIDSYVSGWTFCTPGALDLPQLYYEGGKRR